MTCGKREAESDTEVELRALYALLIDINSLVRKLAVKSDVLLENLKPGSMQHVQFPLIPIFILEQL